MKTSVTYGEILPFLKVLIKYIEKVLKPIGQREWQWLEKLSLAREDLLRWQVLVNFLEDLLQNSLDHVTDVQH